MFISKEEARLFQLWLEKDKTIKSIVKTDKESVYNLGEQTIGFISHIMRRSSENVEVFCTDNQVLELLFGQYQIWEKSNES